MRLRSHRMSHLSNLTSSRLAIRLEGIGLTSGGIEIIAEYKYGVVRKTKAIAQGDGHQPGGSEGIRCEVNTSSALWVRRSQCAPVRLEVSATDRRDGPLHPTRYRDMTTFPTFPLHEHPPKSCARLGSYRSAGRGTHQTPVEHTALTRTQRPTIEIVGSRQARSLLGEMPVRCSEYLRFHFRFRSVRGFVVFEAAPGAVAAREAEAGGWYHEL